MPPSQFSRLFLLLAAFAACVQWTVPHGWMIGAGKAGSAVLVPCPATSPELARLSKAAHPGSDDGHGDHHAGMHGAGMDHGAMGHGATTAHAGMDHADDSTDDHGADDHGAAQAMCDFAAMGAPILPPDLPVLTPPPFAADAPSLALPDAVPGRGLAAPPPPSTGPPISRA
jgi:hypothetical protein